MRLFPWTLLFVSAIGASASEPEEVSFRRDIAPLLHRHCVACHGEETQKGDYRLDNFAALVKPGSTEFPSLTPGKPEDSELYNLLVETDTTSRMPQKAEPLSAEEIARVRRWIEAGAVFDGPSETASMAALSRDQFLGEAPESYPIRLPATAMAFSPDGSQLAVAGYREIVLWDITNGRMARRLGGLPERITGIAWSAATGGIALSGGSPSQWGTVALVDPAGERPPEFLYDFGETALALALHPDGKMIAIAAGDRTVRFVDLVGRKPGERVLRHHADWIHDVAYDREGRLLTSGRDRSARITSKDGADVEATYGEHTVPLLGGIFLEDGRRVATVDRDAEIQLWDARSGTRRGRWKEMPKGAQKLVLWQNSVVVAGSSPELTRHDSVDGRQIQPMLGHSAPITSFAKSPDGQLLASGDASGEVLIWQAGCETWVHRFTPLPLRASASTLAGSSTAE